MSAQQKSDAEDEEVVEIVNVRRRQGRAKETRRKILEGATAEFASSGFDGVTTRSIADRAGVPHGLVIYHFESKLGVWEAVIENVVADFHEDFMRKLEELKDADPVTKLRAVSRNFIYMAATRPEMHWLMSHEVGGASERLTWLLERMMGPDVRISADLIHEAQLRGQYIEGDPVHLHFIFLGAASRVFMLGADIERTLGQSPFDEMFIEQHIGYVEKLFFRNI